MSTTTTYHVAVMLHEAVTALAIKPNGIYVDCTMGGAGHTQLILEQLNGTGKLICFDQDADAARNLPKANNVIFVNENFKHLTRFLRLHGITEVDGVLADLGVSSYQFDEPTRGFSTRFDGPLDMRMDTRQPLTAASILQSYTAQELQFIFQEYGEVTNAKTLAQFIQSKQSSYTFTSINEFKQLIASLVKGNPQKYFAQVFQALRIQVNNEMEVISELVNQAATILKPTGRLAIISFHSVEDRAVKNAIKGQEKKEEKSEVTLSELYGNKKNNWPLQLVNKKPIEPSANELKQNPRSRSAKLRVAQKI
jgi:16S rRNA (cytosine1402-N4)-methyltransferase